MCSNVIILWFWRFKITFIFHSFSFRKPFSQNRVTDLTHQFLKLKNLIKIFLFLFLVVGYKRDYGLVNCASMTMGCFVSSEFLWSIGFIWFRSLLKPSESHVLAFVFVVWS